MARQPWSIVPLVGLLVLAWQLRCHDARKLGPFIRYRSSLVLHFQPHLHIFGGYSALESSSAYIDNHEKEEVIEGIEQVEEDKPEEEDEEVQEPHPADELLQSHKADGTQSYILGGY